MFDPLTVAYAISTTGLLVGVGVVALLLSDKSVAHHRTAFGSLMIIPGFAALAYLVMAFDIGVVTVNGSPITVPRYVDWAVTTPVLVGFVGYVADAPRRWIAGVAVADLLMIVLGGAASVSAGSTKWLLYGASSVFYISLLVIIYRVFPSFAAEHPRRFGLFKLLQNHIGLLWIGYPLLWIAAPAGFGYISATGFGLIIAYLDVVAKTPYVYFIWQRRQVFTDRPSTTETLKPANVTPAADMGD
jgi:Bacteriorhodopsin